MTDSGVGKEALERLLAKLDENKGRARVVEGYGWAVLLIAPAKAALVQFKHELHDPVLRPDAQENLFKKMAQVCVIGDAEVTVAALLEFAPMAPEGCSDMVNELVGLKATERVKA